MQEAFICPIGLELGTSNPFEIAVSIIAQMLQRRDELRAVGSAKLPAQISEGS